MQEVVLKHFFWTSWCRALLCMTTVFCLWIIRVKVNEKIYIRCKRRVIPISNLVSFRKRRIPNEEYRRGAELVSYTFSFQKFVFYYVVLYCMSKWETAEQWYYQCGHKIMLTHANTGDNLAAYTRNRSHQRVSLYNHVYGSNARELHRRTRPQGYL